MKDPEEFGPDKKAPKRGFKRYYCKACEADKQRDRMAKNEGPGAKDQGKNLIDQLDKMVELTMQARRPDVPGKSDAPLLVLDFSYCPNVLPEIERRAAENLRTIAMQALWMLKGLVEDV